MNLLPTDIDYVAFLAKQESQFIRPAADFAEAVGTRLESGSMSFGDTLPWIKTHQNFRFRPSEVTIWAGRGGNGKSLMIGQVLMRLLRWVKGLIASLEMPPDATIARMIRQAAGCECPSDQFQADWFDWSRDRLWIYDQTDSVEAERILGVIHYAASELKIAHTVVDSLVKCGIAPDDYPAQTNFVDRIGWAAKTHATHVHLVHHVRKGKDPNNKPDGWDMKGAGEIRDLTDNLLLVWRNAVKEEKRRKNEPVDDYDPDAILIVDKQRHGEWTGNIPLFFHAPSMQFVSKPMGVPMPWNFEKEEVAA